MPWLSPRCWHYELSSWAIKPVAIGRIGIATCIPDRPHSVDIAVVQIEDWVERGGARVRHQTVVGVTDSPADVNMDQVVRIAFEVAMGTTGMCKATFRTTEPRRRRCGIGARKQVVGHSIRIHRTVGNRWRTGNKNVSICVGAVTHGDVEGIGSAVWQSLGRERGRHLVLAATVPTKVIPIRQCPIGRTTEAYNVLPQLRLQRHKIATMPGKKVPAAVL